MANSQWVRFVGIIAILGTALLVAGYRLIQPELQRAIADLDQATIARVVETRSLDTQATTVDEVLARQPQGTSQQMVVFENKMFGYHLDYPLGWEVREVSINISRFQSPNGETRVDVEAVGALPAGGLSPFVERSISNDMILSHQLLTVHGQAAERVIAFSEALGVQKTSFFVESDASAFVITGIGEQKMIEMMARSFNAPQAVAQR